MNKQMADSLSTKTANHLSTANHLDDDQFSALLAGEQLAVETQAHLDACMNCRLERDRIAESMDSFSALGLDWAERRSATMPPVRVSSERAAWIRPVAWAAATAVLALGVTLGVRHDQSGPVADVAQAPVASSGVIGEGAAVVAPRPSRQHLTREQQIAADNRMLLAIRHELARPDMLGVSSPGARHSRTGRMENNTDTVNN